MEVAGCVAYWPASRQLESLVAERQSAVCVVDWPASEQVDSVAVVEPAAFAAAYWSAAPPCAAACLPASGFPARWPICLSPSAAKR